MKFATTLLVFCVGALLSLGLVALYSAGMLRESSHQSTQYVLMQLIWGAAGLVGAAVAASIDYRWLRKAVWPLLGVTLVLLALVLLSAKTKGAHRWFRLGIVSFQPSELAKLVLIIVVAHYGDRYRRYMHSFVRGLLVPGLIIGSVLALVFVEPDRGTTILMVCVTGLMLILAGARLWFLAPTLVTGAIGLGFCLWYDPVRRRRIVSWLYPEDHKQDAGYQVWRSIVGIGNGGVDGLGLGNGLQKAFVPDHHTDFIFTVIGEELGLVATLATLAAFMVLLFCGAYIARRASDGFGFLLASGITFLIALQAVINVGVVTGALPNKGLPLPFISYGGSSLVFMLVSIGLLLSVARRARDPLSEEVEPETLSAGAVTPFNS